MPLSRWKRVPAAGMSPAESAVEPDGTSSRSMTTASMPDSFAASAAQSPAAPAPTMMSGTCVSNFWSTAVTTTALIRTYSSHFGRQPRARSHTIALDNGIVKKNVAPPAGRFSAHILPP